MQPRACMTTLKKIVSVCIVASLGACTHSNDTQTRTTPAGHQVNAAQEEASAAYQRAHDAQENAQNKSNAALRAEADAQQKQQEALEAQRRAVRAREDAQEAQQQAMIVGREAEERAQDAQQRAIREQPRAESQAIAQGPIASERGTVQSVSRNEIVIQRPAAPPLHVRIDSNQTTITRDGQPVQANEINNGQPVIVSYRLEQNQPVAQMVEVGGAAQRPQQPQSMNDSRQP